MSRALDLGGEVARFTAFMAKVGSEARDAGILSCEGELALADVQLNARALARNRAQPEHELAARDYFGRLVSSARIERGRALLTAMGGEFARIEAAFGVPGPMLVAIWGIESNFGAAMGDDTVLESLASLAFGAERRGTFWCRELMAALAILARGDIGAGQLVGSWAGAMGHTQFMPSTYLEHGVDFDGDGVSDIWRSAVDGLASAAHYLSKSGWKAEASWGHEVMLAEGFDFSCVDPARARCWKDWLDAGAAPAAVEKAPWGLLRLALPAGWRGPAFLVTANFDALLTYNRSEIYALSAGCLADAIAGGTNLRTEWPEETPLTFAERCELQQFLVAAGFDTNGIDGILGRASVRGARAYQLGHGLKADGYPGPQLLNFMRERGV